jgi:iron complex transport system substrate-binding protein
MFILKTNMNYAPERIICLTEESTETLYLLGEEDRIVGVSGFTVRPKKARKEKPTVSAFIDAQIEEILDLKPDMVIGFSDIQADIAKQLIAKGVTVWVNNYRSVAGILRFILQLGALVEKQEAAQNLVASYKERLETIKKTAMEWEHKPKVYFEEWYDPIITGIQWVSELIEIAGGEDVYSNLKDRSLAKDRIIADHREILTKDPDIILASWCGKMFKPKRMFEREGWKEMKAYKNQQFFEIDSSIILQPGPACLTDGIEQIHQHFLNWQKQNG